MFIDNVKKIICLSVPETDSNFANEFFRSQFESNSISVTWFRPQYTKEQLAEFVSQIPENLNEVAKIQQVSAFNASNISEISNISELINANYLEFPITEYDVYSLSIDPILRILKMYENTLYTTRKKNFDMRMKNYDELVARNENPDLIIERPVFPDIKNIILDSLRKDFIDVIGTFAPERYQYFSYSQQPQVYWLKHNNQTINHIYKYTNYTTFVSDICSRYNISASYDDSARLNSRKTDLSVEDIPQEIKDKILEKFAEDKALYDSL